MTNLYPGMLFYASGLNRKSTPLPPEATPSEIDQKLGRASFNGRPWPKSSPISHVYDVRNSSTRMIILNNKLSKKPKGSRLRGQTDHLGEIERPEPFRHTSDEPHTNWHHHKRCATSVSERFVPVFPTGMSKAPAWVNKTQRPAMKFDNGSSVNPNHHIQCQGHMDYDIVRWYNNQRRPRSRTSTSTRENRALSPILNDPSLTRGEKRYLNHIAKIYSVDNMRVQKQQQYNELMWSEIRKGRFRQSDLEKYHKYLNTPRKTQFGPCDPNRSSRSISAPGKNRKIKEEDDDDSRPCTTQTGAKRSSREPSSSRPSTDRKGQRGGAGQKYLKSGSKSDRKGDDLTGQPARVESPLPLVPRKDSTSSLSSKGSEKAVNAKDEKQISNSSEENDTGRAHDDGYTTKKNVSDSQTKPASDEADDGKRKMYDEIDKRKEEDDDERSKLSARDNNERHGGNDEAVAYYPTSNERVEEEDRSRNDRLGKDSQDGGKEEYKPNEEDKVSTSTSALEENPVIMLPQTDGQKADNAKNKRSTDEDLNKGGFDDSNDNDVPIVRHLHKEGGDRPLSRLGGRGQFTLVKKDNADNSDDDYSDDDEETPQKSDDKKGEAFFESTGDQSQGQNLPKTGSDTKNPSASHHQDDSNVKLSLEAVGNIDRGANWVPAGIKSAGESKL